MSDKEPPASAGDSDTLSALGAIFQPACACDESPSDEILMMTVSLADQFIKSDRPLPEGGLPALIRSTYGALAEVYMSHLGYDLDEIDVEDATDAAH